MNEQMKSKSIVLAGVIVALGIIGGGIALSNGIIRVKSMERTVTVKGLSEAEVPADKVLWNISFSRQGNNLQQLYSDIDKDRNIIVGFLKKSGLDDSEIFPSSPRLMNMSEQYMYTDRIPPYAYSLNLSLIISSDKIDVVRGLTSTIAAEMSKSGIAVREYASYSFTGLSELKPKMIEDATANARASAQKFAEDSRSKIGKILTANQGVFSVDDLDETTPYMKKVRVVTTVVYYLN